MSFQAESFSDCAMKASSEMNLDAKYFFWSPHQNPVGKEGLSNCLTFKSCDANAFTDLTSQGYTYLRCPPKGNFEDYKL